MTVVWPRFCLRIAWPSHVLVRLDSSIYTLIIIANIDKRYGTFSFISIYVSIWFVIRCYRILDSMKFLQNSLICWQCSRKEQRSITDAARADRCIKIDRKSLRDWPVDRDWLVDHLCRASRSGRSPITSLPRDSRAGAWTRIQAIR